MTLWMRPVSLLGVKSKACSQKPYSGVSLEGKIAIARYGGIFRGLKVSHSQRHMNNDDRL